MALMHTSNDDEEELIKLINAIGGANHEPTSSNANNNTDNIADNYSTDAAPAAAAAPSANQKAPAQQLMQKIGRVTGRATARTYVAFVSAALVSVSVFTLVSVISPPSNSNSLSLGGFIFTGYLRHLQSHGPRGASEAAAARSSSSSSSSAHVHESESDELHMIALEEVLRAAAFYVDGDGVIRPHRERRNNIGHGLMSMHAGSDPDANDEYDDQRTVIITTINAAWADDHRYSVMKQAASDAASHDDNDDHRPIQHTGSMVDMFMESMREGLGTRKLMKHLVVGCMDHRAYERCIGLMQSTTTSDHRHRHHHHHVVTSANPNSSDDGTDGDGNGDRRDGFQCIRISTPGVDFSGEQLLLSADYIKMMWRRIELLASVLRLGYSFIFTDADILWLRDPIPALIKDREADFQIACDSYNGRPADVSNWPNAGFTHARANKRTAEFYEYWHGQRTRDARMADQEVLNAIKSEPGFARIGLKLRFLDTRLFGGFCSIRSAGLATAVTMHANCCKGLDAKLRDLRVVMDDWSRWKRGGARQGDDRFKLPWACPRSWH